MSRKHIVLVIGLIGIAVLALGFRSVDNNVAQRETQRIDQIVVPHHLFAQKEMHAFYSDYSAKNSGYDRIVIVSPDHYVQGSNAISLRAESMQIERAVHTIDTDVINALDNHSDIGVENSIFKKEHGIFVHLSFVEEYFGEVPIVPIMMHLGSPEEGIDHIARIINDLPGKNLIIYSIDFSHNLDRGFASIHDQYTIDALSILDEKRIRNSDIDCPECIGLAFNLARKNNQNTFKVHTRTSAADIAKYDYPGENTSHILGSFENEDVEEMKKNAYLFFGGDVIFDRGMLSDYTHQKDQYYDAVFGKIDRLLWAWDAVVWNMESIISPEESISANSSVKDAKHLQLRSSEKTFALVAEKIPSQLVMHNGNNHSLDFGREALQSSRDIMSEMDIGSFGDVRGQGGIYADRVVGDRDMRFVSYNAFLGSGTKEVIDAIREGSELQYDVIVYTHWGIEYGKIPSETERESARKFIDAGARLVIGSHPHVVQPIERYKDGIIFYSLGNFVFDQHFSRAVSQRMALGCKLSDDETECVFSPLTHEKGKPLAFSPLEEREVFYKEMSENSDVSDKDRNDLKRGEITAKRVLFPAAK